MGAPVKSSHGPVQPLPAALYNAIANPAVLSYKLAAGRYSMPAPIVLQRSNFNLDFNGSTLVLTHPTGYPFFADSLVDAFVDVDSPARNASHLTGTITTGTTQLIMDAAEVENVTPGEIVSIVAGTNTSDPVEPFKYFTKTVQSKVGLVVTFTEPFDDNVPVYASEADLKTYVDPSLWYKIGPWGDNYSSGANYFKGLGTDHGMIRFTGGMSHDITLRNFHLETTLPTDAAMTVTMTMFFRDILRLKLLNWSANNFFGSLVHTWRCDDFISDGLRVTGEGRSKIFEPDQITIGYIMSAWGGSRITYRNTNVRGTNMALANTEVSPTSILFQNLIYDVTFRPTFNYGSTPTVLGFFGTTLGNGARIEDSSLKVAATGGQDWAWDPNTVVNFENLVIPMSTFGKTFAFDLHNIEGTITVGGVVYGPLVVDTETVNVTGAADFVVRYVQTPRGFYKSMRFRVTTQGGANEMYDGFGNDYTAALSSGAWTNAISTVWYQPHPTNPLTTGYFDKQKFQVNKPTNSVTVIEFECSYYPVVGASWVVN